MKPFVQDWRKEEAEPVEIDKMVEQLVKIEIKQREIKENEERQKHLFNQLIIFQVKEE